MRKLKVVCILIVVVALSGCHDGLHGRGWGYVYGDSSGRLGGGDHYGPGGRGHYGHGGGGHYGPGGGHGRDSDAHGHRDPHHRHGHR